MAAIHDRLTLIAAMAQQQGRVIAIDEIGGTGRRFLRCMQHIPPNTDATLLAMLQLGVTVGPTYHGADCAMCGTFEHY